MQDRQAERTALVLALSTFLFVGALRSFLAAVYYDNLVALELGPTAAYALLLLAPILFFVPALARRPRATMLGGAIALVLARLLLAPTRGTELHLPLAGLGAAAWLLLLGALLRSLTPRLLAPAAAGIALGWALDVALVWWGDSADPTATLRGLAIVAPVGALLLWTAWGLGPGPDSGLGLGGRGRGAWLAGAALGVWLFVENTLAGNPYGAARWNDAAPAQTAAASVVGLLVGALLVARVRRWPRAALLALHAGALLALLDHAYLHTRAFPLLLAILQATLVVDLALLLPRLTARALTLAGLVTLLLHFAYAFTYLFAYVPGGPVWKGQAPTLYALAGIALLAVGLWGARAAWDTVDGRARRALATLLLAPALVAVVAAAMPAAAVVAPAGAEMRVLSFNVHQGFSNAGVVDAEPFVRVLEAADADLVVLQEADSPRFTSGNVDVATLLAERLGYHHVYGQPTRAQAFGGAILSRHPVAEWHAHPLPSTTDDRWFTEARIVVDGRDVWVYAVHLALPHEGRIPEVDVLLAQAATRSGPTILAGDFNSCPSGLCPSYEEGVSDDVYATVTARYQDAWAAAGHAVDDPAGMTWDAAAPAPTERIDYVFASAEFRVLEAATVRTDDAHAASDHLPVFARLALG